MYRRRRPGRSGYRRRLHGVAMVEHPLPPALTDEGDKPVPLWQKAAGVVFVLAWAAIVYFWHDRAHADFYPFDRSYVSPNLVASYIIFSLGLIAGSLLWPPFRRRIHRAFNKKLAPLHHHLVEATAQRERHHAELMAAHAEHAAHLRHLIHHGADNPAYTSDTPDDGKEASEMAKGQSPAKRATRTAKATPTVKRASTTTPPEPAVVKKAAKTTKKAAGK